MTEINVLLCSTSPIKKEATRRAFIFNFPGKDIIIHTLDCSCLNLLAQPIGCAQDCALTRLKYGVTNYQEYQYYVAIENGITSDYSHDEGYVILFDHKKNYIEKKLTKIPKQYRSLLSEHQQLIRKDNNICGYPITLGELIVQIDPTVDPKNWMKTTNNDDRTEGLTAMLHEAVCRMLTE